MAPLLAANVFRRRARVGLMFRRRGLVLHAFAIAFTWLAATRAGFAAPAAPTWSLLPQPADMRVAPSGVVKIADGALVAIRAPAGMARAKGADGSVGTSGADGAAGSHGAGGTAGSGGAVAATSSGGASVAGDTGGSEQLQRSVDRFIQLVANTRGLRLHTATKNDAHAAITFELDPHANVVGDSGYRIEISPDAIRVIAR